MSLKRLITLEDLVNSTDTLNIPREWWEIIGYGGAWRAQIDFGDYAQSQAIKAHQIALINSTVPTESKEEKDSREAGLVVIRPSYDLA